MHTGAPHVYDKDTHISAGFFFFFCTCVTRKLNANDFKAVEDDLTRTHNNQPKVVLAFTPETSAKRSNRWDYCLNQRAAKTLSCRIRKEKVRANGN